MSKLSLTILLILSILSGYQINKMEDLTNRIENLYKEVLPKIARESFFNGCYQSVKASKVDCEIKSSLWSDEVLSSIKIKVIK